ncbi:MAG: DUF3604 domain-containing protein [Candidatus Lokiarchaeota archaeon]|nr:DUF3604 domain-containing protein [Candidatus Lokiarchaeota archaeon]MBD3200957.1 DUF3604 domain-containing protein [Candidatus Lokiarchaeota archaeon]
MRFTLDADFEHGTKLIFRLRGGRNNKNDWYFLQPYDHDRKGYVSLKSNKPISYIPIQITGKELAIHYLIVDKGGLHGEYHLTLSVKNTLSQSIIEDKKKIEILIQFPNKLPKLIDPIPRIKVEDNGFDHFNIICPSLVQNSEKFNLIVRAEDEFNNIVKDFEDKIELSLSNYQTTEIPLSVHNFESNNKGILKILNLSISSSGIYYFFINYQGKKYFSNPIISKREEINKKLFWGYIHGHTNKSDGMLEMKKYFQNLVNAGLDFGTSTEHDHSWETSDRDFSEIEEIVEKYNTRDDFASIFGYEYGTWYTGYGDICIYHFDNSVPILRSDINKYNSTNKIIKNLIQFKGKVLFIGHHTALRSGYRNWDYFNNSLEKLVEIYSTWGSQEYSFEEGNPIPPRYKFFGKGPYARKRGAILGKKGSYVKDALQRGYKLGFVAGGDDHYGAFPSGMIDLDNGIYPSGIMAIWTEELTKESIWKALNNRKCYGSTGSRIIIEFWLEKFFMGDIINLNDHKPLGKSRKLRLIIRSPLKIKKIELIRNNDIYKSIQVNDMNFEWKLQDNSKFEEIFLDHFDMNERFIFYYPRIFLEDLNMAWASPIWITKSI